MEENTLALKTLGGRLEWALSCLAGMSQAELARAVGVDAASITKWKQGRTPGPALIGQAAIALGVDPWWLLTGEGDALRPPESATRTAMGEVARAVRRWEATSNVGGGGGISERAAQEALRGPEDVDHTGDE
jgi:transcriptional regulator with XRE-family HTH domain